MRLTVATLLFSKFLCFDSDPNEWPDFPIIEKKEGEPDFPRLLAMYPHNKHPIWIQGNWEEDCYPKQYVPFELTDCTKYNSRWQFNEPWEEPYTPILLRSQAHYPLTQLILLSTLTKPQMQCYTMRWVSMEIAKIWDVKEHEYHHWDYPEYTYDPYELDIFTLYDEEYRTVQVHAAGLNGRALVVMQKWPCMSELFYPEHLVEPPLVAPEDATPKKVEVETTTAAPETGSDSARIVPYLRKPVAESATA